MREPIQVYLTPDERTQLDQVARTLGVSRSEALRRGVASLLSGSASAASPPADLVAQGILTPARGGARPVPRGKPVAPLAQVLGELRTDRDQR